MSKGNRKEEILAVKEILGRIFQVSIDRIIEDVEGYTDVYLVSNVSINSKRNLDVYVGCKKITPGGGENSNSRDRSERRIQIKAGSVNYLYRQYQQNKEAVLIGYDNTQNSETVFCAFKIKASDGNESNTVSFQIKEDTIESARLMGFEQQSRRSDYACAFIESFFKFYFKHRNWLHDYSLTNLNSTNIVQTQNPNDTVFNKKGFNKLLYGVAGVGKSYKVNQQLNNLNGENEHRIERVVFHPDYLNADFVGQILPTVKKDIGITYEFKAGPFTRILKKAFDNPDQHHYLVIEEINRGNAPAIFGEIFQLLDRNSKGESEYKISNDLIAGFINDTLDQNSDDKVSNGNLKIQNNMIYIPSNLSIYATMNTADQNVFTLDTAFQRRWTMQMMENNINDCEFKDKEIGDTGVTWGKFNTELNAIILQSNKNTLSSEDKRLGAYFVKPHELTIQDGSCLFAEKVIKYLWDDVFKFKKSELFRDDLDSLDQVLKEFNDGIGDEKFNIFVESVRQSLLSSPKPSTEDVADASGELDFVDSKDEYEQ